ncbi:MAG: hypothetical protein WDN49_15215 [Acetobacteraceae bacterium]
MELTKAKAARGVRPGGRVLADALVAQGIDHVFAVRARATSTSWTACMRCMTGSSW